MTAPSATSLLSKGNFIDSLGGGGAASLRSVGELPMKCVKRL
jgi:hypothetical protein